jgi:hypothetical protein
VPVPSVATVPEAEDPSAAGSAPAVRAIAGRDQQNHPARTDHTRPAAAVARPARPVGLRRELLAAGALYLAYSVVRVLVTGARATAFANARREIALERALGVERERALQRLVLAHPLLVAACDAYYALATFLVTGAVAWWLAARHPLRYLRLRRSLVGATAAALVVFALFPVMPPRLLPRSYGFVDTLARIGGAGPLDGHVVHVLGDPYAAMPSLHVAWAVWCAAAAVPVLTRRAAKLAAALYPLVTAVVVVVTANHLFVEVAAGAVLAAVALRAPGLAAPVAARARRLASRLVPRLGVGQASGAPRPACAAADRRPARGPTPFP